MMESTAERAAITHILCCSWAICLSAAASSEKFQGSMNLASNTAPVCSTRPSSVAPIHWWTGCRTFRLHIFDCVAAVALVPASIEVLGDGAKLDNQLLAEVLRRNLTPLLAPEPDELVLIIAHDDPGVGASNKGPAID